MFSASLMGSGIQPTEVVAAVRNTSVEVVLPEGGRGLQLSCSGWSSVLGSMPLAARQTSTSPMRATLG